MYDGKDSYSNGLKPPALVTVIRVSGPFLGLDQGTGETRTGSREPLDIIIKVDPLGLRDTSTRHVDVDRLSIPSKGRTQLVQLRQTG